jgi:hypothetical protein
MKHFPKSLQAMLSNRLCIGDWLIRRHECDTFAKVLGQDGFEVQCLGDVKDEATFQKVKAKFGADTNGGNAAMCERLDYIYHAQRYEPIFNK